MVMKSDRNPNPNKKSPSKTTWDFLLLDFFLRISRHKKKKKQGIGVNKKNMDPSRSPKSQRKALNWNTPENSGMETHNDGPWKWWTPWKKCGPFLVCMLNFWGVHCTLPKTKSYFCSPLRRKSLPIHSKNGSRSKVSQQRPSGAFDVSFTEWKPQNMERESSYTRPLKQTHQKNTPTSTLPPEKGLQLQAFKGEEKKWKENKPRGLVILP